MFLAKHTTAIHIADEDALLQEDYIKTLFEAGFEETTLPKPSDGKEYVIQDGLWKEEAPSLSIQAHIERSWRDGELITYVDHFQKVLVWGELTSTQKTQLEQYRVALLSYPQTEGFPYEDRPSRPEILKLKEK